MPTAGSIIFYDSGGNLSEDNSNLFWDNTNKRVGIGTNSPSRTVSINGSSNAYQSFNTGGTERWTVGYESSEGRFIFYGGDGTTQAYRMTIKHDGKVGIGTLTPGKMLEIYKTGEEAAIQITGDVNQQQVIYFKDSAARWAIYKPASTTDLRFWDGGSDRVIFKNGGQVGIGTTSPMANVLTHIYGSGSSFKHAIYGEIAYATGVAGTKIGVFGVVTGSAVGDAYGSAGVFGRTSTYTTPGSGYGVPVGTFGDCDPIGQYANPSTTSGRDYVQFAIEADCWSIHESAAGVRAVLKTNTAAGRAIWGSCSPTGTGKAGYFEGTVGITSRGGNNAILEIDKMSSDPSSYSAATGKLYVKNGALYYMGTSGTVTKIADA